MIIEEISNYNSFLKIYDDYSNLWQNSIDKNIFNSPIFLKNYIKTYENKFSLKILTVRNNGILVGLAPLTIHKKKFGFLTWNELRFATEGDYRGFVVKKNSAPSDPSEDEIIKSILNEINKFNCERICLDYISQNSSLFRYLSKNDYFNPKLSYHIQVPKLDINQFEDFNSFSSCFPKKTNKYRNKLLREHNYKLVVVDKMNDELLEEMSSLHIKEKDFHISNGNKNRYSLYEDSDRKNYIFNVQKEYDNVLYFMLRRVSDNKLICYRNTYKLLDTIYSWNTAYDPEFASYRVNNTFFYEIFKYVFENSISKNFNFGSGGYPWKFSFTDKFDVLYKLDYFNSNGKLVDRLLKLKKCLK